MSISIRPAHLVTDRAALVVLLRRDLNPLYDARRFDWLYTQNPAGPAQAWVATDTMTGAIVGTSAAFPRRMSLQGQEHTGWVLGDFCMQENYRSLGPALQLQRACMAAVDTGLVPFWYDFPSTSMMAVYTRLRITPFRQMLRLAKPLRVDRKIQEVIPVAGLARGLSAVGNLFLRLRGPHVGNPERITVAVAGGAYDDAFTRLAHEGGQQGGVWLQHSSTYLNWRYLQNPFCRYECMTARRQGHLVGYVVFTQTGEDAALVDFWSVDESAVLRRLIQQVTLYVRQRGAVTVSASMIDTHPWIPILQRLGFMVRETSPMVLYLSPRLEATRHALCTTPWLLMQGDRDS